MTPEEKSAYRRLLADGVILMRAWSSKTYREGENVSQTEALAEINALADLFHNIAIYSAVDFEGFSPDAFWAGYHDYCHRFPDFAGFEPAFQRYRAGDAK